MAFSSAYVLLQDFPSRVDIPLAIGYLLPAHRDPAT